MAQKDEVMIEGLKFEQEHGKQRVRVGRVWKDSNGFYHFVEWNVGITLFSDCVRSYVNDDNSDIVATDTMKNTVIFFNTHFLESSVLHPFLLDHLVCCWCL